MQEKIMIFGEVLFDQFPDGHNILGGAPFNVAWHLHAFGANPLFISRVGDDDNGKQILEAMYQWGMNPHGMQVDTERPTGYVAVSFDQGEPHYDIGSPVAYDFIEYNPQLVYPASAILYHGSLCLRNQVSRQSLAQLRQGIQCRTFVDINLRAPWWQYDEIHALIGSAHWLKLNVDELSSLFHDETQHQKITALFAASNIAELLLTEGEKGALSLTREGQLNRIVPTRQEHFVDAVGAGDAFSSVFLLGQYLSWPIVETLERAQAFASAIVGIQGATTHDKHFYQTFKDAWNL